MNKRIIGLCSAMLAISTLGCGQGDLAGIEVARGEIINGTPVATDFLGTVLVASAAGECTGTLLGDRWVLTAHHCATVESVPTGGTPLSTGDILVEMVDQSGAGVDQIYLHPLVDVALLHLSHSLINPNNPSGVAYENPLDLRPASSLAGGAVYCQGWGDSTFAPQDVPVLRSAVLNVSSASASTFHLVPTSGQILWHGDSGASCFATVDGVARAVGVHSVGQHVGTTVTGADMISNDAFRAWAEGIMGNAPTMFRDANFGGGSAQALSPGGPHGGFYNTAQLTVGNDSISSLTVPLGWFVTLYKDVNFANVLATYSSTTSLVASNVNEQTSSVSIAIGGVYLRAAGGAPLANYSSAGRYTLVSKPSVNNLVSAISVPAGWRVTLYDNTDFTGANATFNEGSYATLGSFNNLASSLVVEEPVAVYVDSDYNGAYSQMVPDCYDLNALGVPNDSISSIFIPAGMTVTVYPDFHFGGTPTTYTTSQSSVGNLNDQISSLCVSRS